MKVRELNQYLNMDVEGSLSRFAGMESMYVKFLKKFLDDPTYGMLTQAVENNDLQGIEHSAHTLKGICGNLGLTDLYQTADLLVKAVRENRTEEIQPLYHKTAAQMEQSLKILKKLE